MKYQAPAVMAHGVPTYMAQTELDMLADLAAAVPENGLIVEVGSFYGGSTATLALAAPNAHIVAIDEFSWSPIKEEPASLERLRANLSRLGIHNVEIIATDSRKVGAAWVADIDLLFIDGGHEYEECAADLAAFGPHAKVLCVHDHGNDGWPGVARAVSEFMAAHQGFEVAGEAHTLISIKRWGNP